MILIEIDNKNVCKRLQEKQVKFGDIGLKDRERIMEFYC